MGMGQRSHEIRKGVEHDLAVFAVSYAVMWVGARAINEALQDRYALYMRYGVSPRIYAFFLRLWMIPMYIYITGFVLWTMATPSGDPTSNTINVIVALGFALPAIAVWDLVGPMCWYVCARVAEAIYMAVVPCPNLTIRSISWQEATSNEQAARSRLYSIPQGTAAFAQAEAEWNYWYQGVGRLQAGMPFQVDTVGRRPNQGIRRDCKLVIAICVAVVVLGTIHGWSFLPGSWT